jgi:hypothetical protein
MVVLLWSSSITMVGVADGIMVGVAEDLVITIPGVPAMAGMDIIMEDGIMDGVADGTIPL